MDEPLEKEEQEGAVAESVGDTDIDQLLRSHSEVDAALHRQKAEFTVLFTDIVGSTSFFDRFGDTAGLMMLERHQELVLPAIEKAGGTVIKTIGDAVLAVFAAPTTAVHAAREIQQNLDTYNEDRPQVEHIYVRVGLNAGSGFVKERDVYGDVVNVAARIVKACAPAQILISKSVYEGVVNEPDITLRALGSAAFHGKAAMEEIYEILWTGEDRYRRIRERLEAAQSGRMARSTLGRYEILEELGRGAMGVVYKAYDPTVGRIVALKTVRLDTVGRDRDELVRRLRQEAQAAGRLEHPNIVTIHDAGEIEGLFYITMQFVKGRMLSELIAERALLSMKQIALLMDQVLDGLHYAHERGIIHRDLKPSNVVVSREGVVKVVDFGVAKIAETSTTRAGLVLGTPSYMSPEQAQGGRVDRRSDIFALGSILYELLTSEKAFPGNTPTTVIYKIVHEEPIPPRAIEPSIDPALDAVVRKALGKDPFQRYQTCQEMRSDLQAFLASKREGGETGQLVADLQAFAAAAPAPAAEPGAAPGLRPSPPPGPRAVARLEPAPARRGRRVMAILSGVVLLLGVGAWYQGWLSRWLPPALQRGSQERAPGIQESTTAEPVSAVPGAAEPGLSATEALEEMPAGVTGQEGLVSAETPTVSGRASPPPPDARSSPASVEKAREAPSQPKPAVKKPPAKPPAPAKPVTTLTPEQQQQVDSWFRQAEQYFRQGEYGKAIFALDQVVAIDRANQRAQEMRERARKAQALREGPKPP